jgi:hypothetical protein
MIFMLARVCTHFVKQNPLKPLKPLSWFILLTVECGFLFWVSSPGSSSRWWDAHRVQTLVDCGKQVNDLWRKHMRTPNAADAHNKDMISHFVLRLVYCRT